MDNEINDDKLSRDSPEDVTIRKLILGGSPHLGRSPVEKLLEPLDILEIMARSDFVPDFEILHFLEDFKDLFQVNTQIFNTLIYYER